MISKLSTVLKRIRGVHRDDGIRGVMLWCARFPPNWVGQRVVRSRSLSRRDLRTSVASCGDVWHLEPEDTIRIEHSTDEEQRLFGEYPDAFDPTTPFVCEVEGFDIVGPKAIALSDGKVIMETVHLPRFDLDILKGNGESAVEPVVVLHLLDALSGNSGNERSFGSESVFLLVCQDTSYYHWIVEYLPKLRLLERYQTETGQYPTILIEPSPPDYVLQSLELAGYDSDRYERWSGSRRHVERLLVPSHRTQVLNPHVPDESTYQPSISGLTWLRSRVLGNLDADSGPDSGTRIYVSRQETQSNRGRRVLNYEELMSFLDERGFTSYALEKLSFEQQVELFADAQVIAGPHGAGLVNMLFANDPVVVEFFAEHRQEPYFYHMAKMLGFDYAPVVAESRGDDFLVDVPSLRDHFDELGI